MKEQDRILYEMLKKPDNLNKEEIVLLKKRLNMTVVNFSNLFALNPSATKKWCNGETRISKTQDIVLRLYMLNLFGVSSTEMRHLFNSLMRTLKVKRSRKNKEEPNEQRTSE